MRKLVMISFVMIGLTGCAEHEQVVFGDVPLPPERPYNLGTVCVTKAFRNYEHQLRYETVCGPKR